MSKLTIALGSFMVGAIASTWISFSSNHLSLIEQSWAELRAFDFPGGEPIVPPIKEEMKRSKFKGITQSLDGLKCIDCKFTNVTLEYAGGSYALIGASFSGKTRIILKGAALNTVSVLGLMDMLSGFKPLPNAPIPPNKREEFEINNPTTITLSSPDVKG